MGKMIKIDNVRYVQMLRNRLIEKFPGLKDDIKHEYLLILETMVDEAKPVPSDNIFDTVFGRTDGDSG